MKFKKTAPYNIHNKFKGWISTLLIAGMPLVSCGEDNPIDPVPPQPQPPVMRDVTISFTRHDYRTKLSINELRPHINQSNVANVILKPSVEGEWDEIAPKTITLLNTAYLQPAFALSPKVKAAGNFNFFPGMASQVPDDSLAIVKLGYTINQR